jgi:putative ABC transport system substrate-binding protein
MQRREFIRHLGSLCISAAPSLFVTAELRSQPARKRPIIAWLVGARNRPPEVVLEDTVRSFIRGLSDLGYVQGQNYDFIARNTLFPDPVADLDDIVNRIKPDVIIAAATWEAVVIRRATSTIPIVCPAIADGVHLGLIASEARPGGNITGIEPYIAGLPTKQIELVREILPTAKRVGLLTDMSDPKGPPQLGDLKRASLSLGLEVVAANASMPDEIPAALDSLTTQKVDFVVVLMTTLFLLTSENIAVWALERHLLTVFGYREHVVAGGLVSYGVDLRWIYHRAAYFVDRILKGTKPGDLPIEFPNSLLLTVNVRTAKALGVTLSPSLIARGDEVFE